MRLVEKIFIYIFAGAISIWVVIPIWDMLKLVFSPYHAVFSNTYLPTEFTLKNFSDVFTHLPPVQLLNSAIYATGSSGLALLISTPASYCLSRRKFWGSGIYSMFLLVTQMFSLIVIIFPIMMVMLNMHLINHPASVIFTEALFRIAFAVWVMRGFFDAVPVDVEEVAMVDGCTRFEAFIHIVLPLTAPGLLVTFLISFTTGWNAFLSPLILLRDRNLQPITVGVWSLLGEHEVMWNLVMTGCLYSIIPQVLLAFVLQRYLKKGIMVGAVKG